MVYRMLTDLPAALRASGAPVVLMPGWERRGRPSSTGSFNPRGQIVHHTGNHGTHTRAQEYEYVRRVLVAGFASLPGPLCQIALGRQTVDGPPRIYVVAAGRANHAGKSRTRGFVFAGDGNSQGVGWEALNTGDEGWQPEQLETYHRGNASLSDHYRWPRSNVLAHAETSTAGKWDPGYHGRVINMTTFRRAVAVTQLGADMALTKKEIEAIGDRAALRTWQYKGRKQTRDAYQILHDVEARVKRLESKEA